MTANHVALDLWCLWLHLPLPLVRAGLMSRSCCLSHPLKVAGAPRTVIHSRHNRPNLWTAYSSRMRVRHLGYAPDLVDYEHAWAIQREVHADVVAGAENTTLLLEHTPVYTAGRRTEIFERPVDGTPVVDVDRGGKITWHGPGQLVGYPIVALPIPIDVVAHVRRLEQLMIDVCADLGVRADRVEGRSGTWILADERGPDRKIGAIGVRVSKRATMHGFSLNANCDLSWANTIIPCGIADAGVTSLSKELDRDVPISELLPLVEARLAQIDPAARPSETAGNIAGA